VHDQIFISYSHKDQKWLERLRTHLRPFEQAYQIRIWDDKKIGAGVKWRDEITKALASTKVALLLVSPNFLASEFITREELPRLLEAARKEKIIILWIAISASAVFETEIKDYQAANDPTKPLDTLKPARLNEELVKIGELVKSVMTGGGDETVGDLFKDYSRMVIDQFEERRRSSPHDLQRNLLDFYVEPGGSNVPLKSLSGPAPEESGEESRAVDLWTLIKPHLLKAQPCVVLAEFGMGKSWFLEMIQYRLARAICGADGKGTVPWIPLLVKLRGFSLETPSSTLFDRFAAGKRNTTIFERLREQAWRASLGESQVRDHSESLVSLFESGRFLFLFDALDEVATDSRAEVDRFVTEVGAIGSYAKRSPVILTCRRSFFKDAAQEQSLRDRGFEVFHLWPWSRQNILEYLNRVHTAGLLKTEPLSVWEKIENTYNLRDISSRALLSAMLVNQWEDLTLKQDFDIPSLYELHIEKALLSWQGAKAWQLDTYQLRVYMEEIAFLMFKLNTLSVSAADLDEYFSTKFTAFSINRFSRLAESITRDIKTNSLLLREDDNYVFCHPSIWEFLVARRLMKALTANDESALLIPSRATKYRSIIRHFLMPMLKKENKRGVLI
jgi:hypothetical protein